MLMLMTVFPPWVVIAVLPCDLFTPTPTPLWPLPCMPALLLLEGTAADSKYWACAGGLLCPTDFAALFEALWRFGFA